ncbi:unnamed protein product, partial [Symbiodinium pilosum]
ERSASIASASRSEAVTATPSESDASVSEDDQQVQTNAGGWAVPFTGSASGFSRRQYPKEPQQQRLHLAARCTHDLDSLVSFQQDWF